MSPYEAYCLYLSIKLHFTKNEYDYFRYNGKVNAKIDSFHRRRDKHQFAKLAKHKDPLGYLISQFVAGFGNGWIGDLFTEEAGARYTEYLARQQSLSYNFLSELSRLDDEFLSNFRVKDGQHPPLLVLFKRGVVSIETLTILNNCLNFFPVWDNKIEDTIIWPSIRDRCLKYKSFLSYDKAKIKSFLRPVMAECQAI